jgi:hypothetical protein
VLDHPEWKVNDINSEIAYQWRLATDKQKEKYDKLAHRDKER